MAGESSKTLKKVATVEVNSLPSCLSAQHMSYESHVPAGRLPQLSSLSSFVRAPEAFVSIQLEKVGLRDTMLNTFLCRKQTTADRTESPVSVRGGGLAGALADCIYVCVCIQHIRTYTYEQINILNLASVRLNHVDKAIEHKLPMEPSQDKIFSHSPQSCFKERTFSQSHVLV